MSCGTGQNVIYLGEDNPVVFLFSFTGDFAANGLNSFSGVELTLGNETYNTNADPELFIVSNTELRLKIGATTSLLAGTYTPEIKGYSATYPNGYLITGINKRLLVDILIV